jgi:hypothetical protein
MANGPASQYEGESSSMSEEDLSVILQDDVCQCLTVASQ